MYFSWVFLVILEFFFGGGGGGGICDVSLSQFIFGESKRGKTNPIMFLYLPKIS